MTDITQKPEGFEDVLGDYGIAFSDGHCGEPIAWGFDIIKRVGEERWGQLAQHGRLECMHGGYSPTWCLVVKKLTRAEAEQKYGKITDEEFGPRGGWRSVTFGTKKFTHSYLRPENQ